MAAEKLAVELSLDPHPEGGYFRRVYTAPSSAGTRAHASSILYLLPAGSVGHLHQLKSDELWFYQKGRCLTVTQIGVDGVVTKNRVEPGIPLCVSAGTLFGSSLEGSDKDSGDNFALVACVVIPGFVWEDFMMPSKAELLQRFSGNAEALAAICMLGKE